MVTESKKINKRVNLDTSDENTQFDSSGFHIQQQDSSQDFEEKQILTKAEFSLEMIERSKLNEDITIKGVFLNLLPNILNTMMLTFIYLIEMFFVSKSENTNIMDGLGLGQLYNNCMIYYLSAGLGEGLSVVCSRNFGSKNFTLIGHEVNQMRFIQTVVFIIYLIITLFFTNNVMALLVGGQRPYIDFAEKYAKLTISAQFFDMHYEIIVRYFESHLVYMPVVMCSVIALCFHPLNCWFYILYLDLGVTGAGYASITLNFVKLACILVYLFWFNPYPESNIGYDKNTFKWSHFKQTLLVSLTSLVVFYPELGGNLISEVMVTRLSEVSYQVRLILTAISNCNYWFSYAWLTTSTLLIGNYVGENSPRNIRLSIKYLCYLALIIELPYLLILYCFRFPMARLFGYSEKIAKYEVMDLYLQIICLTQAIYFIQYFILGILRGFNNMITIFITSVLIFLFLNPVLNYIFLFCLNLDVKGSLLCEIIGYSLAAFVFIILYFTYEVEDVCEEFKNQESHDN